MLEFSIAMLIVSAAMFAQAYRLRKQAFRMLDKAEEIQQHCDKLLNEAEMTPIGVPVPELKEVQRSRNFIGSNR